jgi:hypothetical protein
VPGTYDVKLVVTAGGEDDCTGSELAPGLVRADWKNPNTLSPALLQLQLDEQSGVQVANTASSYAAAEHGLASRPDWQGDPGKPLFDAGEPGFGCLARSTDPVSVDLEWDGTLEGSFTLMWWQRLGPSKPGKQGSSFTTFWASGETACLTGGNHAEEHLLVTLDGLGSGGGGGGGGQAADYVSATDVQTGSGQWRHVALVVDGAAGFAQWYFDGAADANTLTFDPAADVARLGPGFRLGLDGDPPERSATYWYDLDDVRVYAEARTPGQIQQDMAHEVATASRFGAGGPGPLATPEIGALAPPSVPGPDFALQLHFAEPGRPCVLALGFSASAWGVPGGSLPLPLDLAGPLGPGCTLLVSPDVLLFGATGTGSLAQPLPIPAAPALKGLHAYAQWIVIGSAGATTRGLDLNLQ